MNNAEWVFLSDATSWLSLYPITMHKHLVSKAFRCRGGRASGAEEVSDEGAEWETETREVSVEGKQQNFMAWKLILGCYRQRAQEG